MQGPALKWPSSQFSTDGPGGGTLIRAPVESGAGGKSLDSSSVVALRSRTPTQETHLTRPIDSPAWYEGTRADFLAADHLAIANQLAGRAADSSLEIQADQSTEWQNSIALLQETVARSLPVLHQALASAAGASIRHVILEYDFRRRGLRMDCILLSDGVIFVLEFKRSRIGRADRDQVMTYAVNLLEFHQRTREWTEASHGIVVPVICLTEGVSSRALDWPGLYRHSWTALAQRPIECDGASLGDALGLGLSARRGVSHVASHEWLSSPFLPSSSILDATLSLYGNHEVAAIREHEVPKDEIDRSTEEIRQHIDVALASSAKHIVFLSGAPGAGKTLVGLDLVMRGRHAAHSVFVTGNAPLVDVLNKALSTSYRALGRTESWAQTGYRRNDAPLVASAATYKVVKAHNFLGSPGSRHRQSDGRVLVFDEAQRTYEMGRRVLGERLEDHEADLILKAQEVGFPTGGAVVVALVGHNQAINRGERGIEAWLEAADRRGWSYSISDETLALAEINESVRWIAHPGRRLLKVGHLHRSMRFYRNASLEAWANAVLGGTAGEASSLADSLNVNGHTIWITRNLSEAKAWVRERAGGSERVGLIASGQARRLAAEGLFVDLKPDIADWMLSPTTDVRSSNALETVQNQFQIQGLELDYCIVCWDADLRRHFDSWAAFKMSGSDWQSDRLVEVAMNGYRVLLTRARKGMVLFVPCGDLTGVDTTRERAFYDGIAKYLLTCGAVPLHGPARASSL